MIAAILLLIAAFIEGVISGSTAGLAIRIVTSLIMLSAVVFYFLVVPLYKRRRERTAADE